MLVSKSSSQDIITLLRNAPVLALDLETTSLNPKVGSIFGLVLATKFDSFYFNVGTFHGDDGVSLSEFEELLGSDTLFIGHNLKFDLSFLQAAGLPVPRNTYCTQVMARVEHNDHLTYSLDACAKRIGLSKDDRVKEYLEKHHHFTRVSVPGKKTKFKEYHFERAPLDLLVEYACQDGKLAYALYESQQKNFHEFSRMPPQNPRPLDEVIELEKKTLPVLLSMEAEGILVNREYCEEAARCEEERLALCEREFTSLTGKPFVDSAKTFLPIFQSFRLSTGETEKGNASFKSEFLDPTRSPLEKLILDHRDAQKRLGTYFSSFLFYSRVDNRIHPEIRQSGTASGRFSCGNPNLQNVTDEEGEVKYPVRRAFIADPDFSLLSIDYKQMEYRLMLEYAQEESLIAEILAGADVHDACAKLMGVPRRTAKTINFMLLYGGGTQKLADSLSVPFSEAQRLRELYFSRLPKVKRLIQGIIENTQRRGYTFNFIGRRSHFTHEFAYKAPNYVIQGGCADIFRRALVACHEALQGKLSKILIPIHDELVFKLHKSEMDMIPPLQACMKNAFQARFLPMDVTAHIGQNLSDLEELAV